MNNVLKNVLRFTGLVVGVPASLPHLLNVNEVPVIPQLVGANVGGFVVTADALNVTVVRQASATSADVDVYVEHWHTIESVLPPGGLGSLVPFVLASGQGVADTGIVELFNDVLAGPGSGSQSATVVGLQNEPIDASAPAVNDFLKYDGSQWTHEPVSVSGPIGTLILQTGPIQNIPSAATAFLPTTTLHRFTVSGGNHALTSTPTINWPGTVTGQVILLQNVSAAGGFHVTLNRGVAEQLSLSNSTKKIDPGGTMTLVFNGSAWVEVSHVESTST